MLKNSRSILWTGRAAFFLCIFYPVIIFICLAFINIKHIEYIFNIWAIEPTYKLPQELFSFNNIKTSYFLFTDYHLPKYLASSIWIIYNNLSLFIILFLYFITLSYCMYRKLKPHDNIVVFLALSFILFLIPSALVLLLINNNMESLLFAAIASLVYVMNYPMTDYLLNYDSSGKKILSLSAYLSLTPVLAIVFSPGLIAALFYLSFISPQKKYKKLIINIGRILCCLLSFYLISQASLSIRTKSPDPKARNILPLENLYDVKFDKLGNKVLVTDKHTEYWKPQYAIAFTPKNTKVTPFAIRSGEVESIALDEKRRRIYHVSRADPYFKLPNMFFEMDLDTLKKVHHYYMDKFDDSSMIIACSEKYNTVFFSTESGKLYSIDLTSHEDHFMRDFGSHALLAIDENDNAIYASPVSKPYIYSLDLISYKELQSSESPRHKAEICLSSHNGEIYVAAPLGSRIWCYKIPGLKLHRKIHTQPGVRCIAVDEDNDLLLSCSYITGYVEKVHLHDGSVAARYYVGPYCRSMALDTKNKRAFITLTKEGLYMLDYSN